MFGVSDNPSQSTSTSLRSGRTFTVDKKRALTRRGRACQPYPNRKQLKYLMARHDSKYRGLSEIHNELIVSIPIKKPKVVASQTTLNELTVPIPIKESEVVTSQITLIDRQLSDNKETPKKDTDLPEKSEPLAESDFYASLAKERKHIKAEYSFVINENGWKVEVKNKRISRKPKYWVQCVSHALIALGENKSNRDIANYLKSISPSDFPDDSSKWIRCMEDAIRDNQHVFLRTNNLVSFSNNSENFKITRPGDANTQIAVRQVDPTELKGN